MQHQPIDTKDCRFDDQRFISKALIIESAVLLWINLNRRRLLILKVHIQDIMVCIWQKFVQNIIGRQCQAGGVDAWVASDQWLIDNFLIHDKLNMMIVIIHQSENTCRARSQIKVGFHIFRRSKR